MRIYRGNIGVELSLQEFSDIIDDEYRLEDLLDTIHELEMDEVMNYDQKKIKEFEEKLFEEATEYKRKKENETDLIRMKRTLKRLEKYER